MYLTLPSDSSSAFFPENTTACFVTKLPQRIKLDGDYEVGLTELIHPKNFINIDNSDGKYWFGFQSDDEGCDRATDGTIWRVYVDTGFYQSESEFVYRLSRQAYDAISRRARDKTLQISFQYDLATCKVPYHLHSERIRPSLYMSEDLKILLGITEKWFATSMLNGIAQERFYLNQTLDLIYVYCDLVSHQCVGDIKAPLLRVVDFSGKHVFTNPYYVPLARKEFDYLEINLRTALGKPFPFISGRSVAIVHIRKRHEGSVLL